MRKKFDEVIERRYQNVLYFLKKKLHDDNAAEDLTQRVFLRAYNAYDRFKPDPELHDAEYSWIMTITYNLLSNYLRDNKKLASNTLQVDDQFGSNYYGDVIDNSQQIISDAHEDLDSEGRLIELINSLENEEWKLMIYLHTFKEMTIADIAHVMGKSEGAMKAQLHRLKLRLAKLKQNKENEDNPKLG